MPRTRFLLSVFAISLIAHAGHALNFEFSIALDGLQETPSVATPGTGTGSLFLDDTTGNYTISGTFQDLLGPSSNAHIHGPAAVGAGPAGVVVGLSFSSGVTSGTFSGAGTFTAPQMAALLNELYYVNIHSSSFTGGEIRGQIELVPEPSTAVLFALGIGWLAVRRRSIVI